MYDVFVNKRGKEARTEAFILNENRKVVVDKPSHHYQVGDYVPYSSMRSASNQPVNQAIFLTDTADCILIIGGLFQDIVNITNVNSARNINRSPLNDYSYYPVYDYYGTLVREANSRNIIVRKCEFCPKGVATAKHYGEWYCERCWEAYMDVVRQQQYEERQLKDE
jgi:ribosomal protein S27AE